MKKFLLFSLSSQFLFALPSDHQVTFGQAEVLRESHHLSISCSHRAIISWENFSIGQNESVQFLQPHGDSVVINRVMGKESSQLMGKLLGNGRVVVINPAGIVVGKGGHVQTASFIASTQDILDRALIDEGKWIFNGDSTAKIIHLGKIEALNGDVFLLAHQIEDQGSVSAPRGVVGYGAGCEILIQPSENGHLFIRMSQGEAAIDQSGTIEAMAIELKAASPYEKAIRASGKMTAMGSADKGGRIHLIAEKGDLDCSGALQASSGGIALVAQTIRVEPEAYVDVSGEGNASSGSIIIRAEQKASIEGKFYARGGEEGGDGGLIEICCKKELPLFKGESDRLAPKGKNGRLEIDPDADIVIGRNASSGGAFSRDPTRFSPSAPEANLLIDTLIAELNRGDVTIVTQGEGFEGTGGNVQILEAVRWQAPTTLMIVAGGKISIRADLENRFEGQEFTAFDLRAQGGSSDHGIEASKVQIVTRDGAVIMRGSSGKAVDACGLTFQESRIEAGMGSIYLDGASHSLASGGRGICIKDSGIQGSAIWLQGHGAPEGTDRCIGIDLLADSRIEAVEEIVLMGFAGGNGVSNHGIHIEGGDYISRGSLAINGFSDRIGAMTYGVLIEGGAHIQMRGEALFELEGSHPEKAVMLRGTATLVQCEEGPLDIFAHGGGRLELDHFAKVMSQKGLITLKADGDIAISESATIEGNCAITSLGSLSISAGIAGLPTGIIPGPKGLRASIDGDLILKGSPGNGSVARIGSLTKEGCGDLIFDRIGGDLICAAEHPNSMVIIGHGTPVMTDCGRGDIIFHHIAGDLLVHGASADGALYGFAQIGHYALEADGKIEAKVKGLIQLVGGAMSQSAYARIGHGTFGADFATGGGIVTLSAGRDIETHCGAAEALITGEGLVTLYVDPFSYKCGGPSSHAGRIVSQGPVEIHSAHSFLNRFATSSAEIDYVGETNGQTSLQELHEPEDCFFPACQADRISPFYSLQVALAQLQDLLPLLKVMRRPGNHFYHTDIGLYRENFSFMPLIAPYSFDFIWGSDLFPSKD